MVWQSTELCPSLHFYLQEPLCGSAMIIVQQTAKPSLASHRSCRLNQRRWFNDQPIPQTLMVPLKMIMSYELSYLVGSGAGAVIRRRLLGCIQRFRLRARLGVAVVPFPAPATSHAACGFPALRAPAHFTARVMGPGTGPSSGCIVGASGPAD